MDPNSRKCPLRATSKLADAAIDTVASRRRRLATLTAQPMRRFDRAYPNSDAADTGDDVEDDNAAYSTMNNRSDATIITSNGEPSTPALLLPVKTLEIAQSSVMSLTERLATLLAPLYSGEFDGGSTPLSLPLPVGKTASWRL